jgi:hypothetical protein
LGASRSLAKLRSRGWRERRDARLAPHPLHYTGCGAARGEDSLLQSHAEFGI